MPLRQSPAVNELQFYLLQDAQNARGNGIDIDTVSEENSVKSAFFCFSQFPIEMLSTAAKDVRVNHIDTDTPEEWTAL